MSVKIAFATCVQLGLSCIECIYKIGGKLDLLITLNDEKAKDKSGRIYLDDFSKINNVELLKINNINEDVVIKKIVNKGIDWLFIIGWSQIAKKDLLNAPTKGCIGMHPTLLPIGRGRAAIPWAILKQLKETGVTLFKLDEGVDTGDIIGQVTIKLRENTNASELYNLVNIAHVDLIKKYWKDIYDDNVVLIKQNEKNATIWEGRKPEDGLLNEDMDVSYAERLVRAVTKPYPGAYFIRGNEKIIVWSAHISNNSTGVYFKCKNGYLIADEFEVIKND